jgi:cytochrome P450
MNSFLVLQNPPRHTLIRSLISKAWLDKDIDYVIQQNIETLMLEFPKGKFDFIERFAQPLPVLTISKILGLSTEAHRTVKKLAMTLTESMGLYLSFKDLVTINEAAKQLVVFFRDQVEQKKKQKDKSLMSAILRVNQKKEFLLSDEEITSLYIFLFIAGEETSSNLIGSGMFNLLRNPEDMEKLRNNTGLIGSAIEELLRYDASIQVAGRLCLEDYTVRNKVIPKGATVSLVIGAANHDPEEFENPDELNLSRQPNRHLSFGAGIHYCMGDWLARRQAQLAFSSLLKRFSSIQLADTPVGWNGIITFRSMKNMEVIVA